MRLISDLNDRSNKVTVSIAAFIDEHSCTPSRTTPHPLTYTLTRPPLSPDMQMRLIRDLNDSSNKVTVSSAAFVEAHSCTSSRTPSRIAHSLTHSLTHLHSLITRSLSLSHLICTNEA